MVTATNEGLGRMFGNLSRAAAASATLLGALVLVGWALDIQPLKSALPGLATVKANTAVNFLLAGVSLWLLASQATGPPRADWRQRAALGTALLVASVGLLTLGEYVAGWDLGIDQLLFEESLTTTEVYPARMAPTTALSFALIGLALFLLDAPAGHYRVSPSLALSATVIALVTLLGYAFSVRSLYAISAYSTMAVHTAATLAGLGVGVVLARPGRWPAATLCSDSAGGVTARRVLPGVIALPVVLGWLRLGGERLGLYDIEFGLALMVTCSIVLLTILVWWSASALDQVDRKRAQSQAMFAALFHSAPDAVLTVNRDGRIAHANEQAQRFFGYEAKELVGQPVELLVPDRARARHTAQHADYFSDGRMRPMGAGREVSGRRKDGSEVLAEINLSPVRTGDELFAMIITRDITERKEAEKALRQSEAKFRGLFETVPVGVFQSTPAGRFLAVNPALVEMLGYGSEEELLAIDITRDVYANPADREGLLCRLEERGVAHSMEVSLRRKDGRRLVALINMRAQRDERGTLVYHEGTLVDITERKRLDERVRVSQRMEAVGRLAGGVAHDFNNLLTVISGYADLSLLQLPDRDPVCENIKEITRAAQRAAELTQQLLAFGRKQILALKVIDLNAIVAATEKMVRRLIGEDIDLVAALHPGLWRVKADAGQIEQVVMNLAANARDAMPLGGRLTFETQNVELDETFAQAHVAVQPGPYVMLAVSDTGSGMDAGTLEHLFEPFFTTKEPGRGTGLGLATVYGIVKQSGGNIWVYSEIGRGTTFNVYLPRVDAPLDAPTPKKAVTSPRGTETILLVEDEAAVRLLARRVLERNGYTVLEAAEGRQAIDLLRQHEGSIHLLLTDVVMPHMSGRALAEQIVSLRPDVKVLYLSGYTANAIAHHGVLDPGTQLLEKPFTPAALGLRVREVLDLSG